MMIPLNCPSNQAELSDTKWVVYRWLAWWMIMFFSEKYVSEIFGGVGYPGTLGDTWIG